LSIFEEKKIQNWKKIFPVIVQETNSKFVGSS